MKEIVDRILNGEDVDIAGDRADYFLTVSQFGENYKIGFTYPDNMKSFHSSISLKSIREAGNKLIALADELEESRKKFRTDERVYYIQTDGNVSYIDFFIKTNTLHLSLIAMGNAFKTAAEAHDNIPAVMAKYQELRDKGLV